METYLEPATFRVVSNNVRFFGATLPQGEYPGYLEWLVIVMHGQQKSSIGRAMMQLSANVLQRSGAKVPASLTSVDCPVLPYLYSGDVTVV